MKPPTVGRTARGIAKALLFAWIGGMLALRSLPIPNGGGIPACIAGMTIASWPLTLFGRTPPDYVVDVVLWPCTGDDDVSRGDAGVPPRP